MLLNYWKRRDTQPLHQTTDFIGVAILPDEEGHTAIPARLNSSVMQTETEDETKSIQLRANSPLVQKRGRETPYSVPTDLSCSMFENRFEARQAELSIPN